MLVCLGSLHWIFPAIRQELSQVSLKLCFVQCMMSLITVFTHMYMYTCKFAHTCACSLSHTHTHTGGADKNAVVFHKDSGQIIATLKGHSKKVTGVVYHPREVRTFHRVCSFHYCGCLCLPEGCGHHVFSGCYHTCLGSGQQLLSSSY